jgi:hypothetical protein
MYEQEALDIIKNQIMNKEMTEEVESALNVAVDALNKQIPQSPITPTEEDRPHCPVCGRLLNKNRFKYLQYYCFCGQRLEWEKENE